MKTLCRQSIGFLLILLLVAGSSPLLAQDQPMPIRNLSPSAELSKTKIIRNGWSM